jgi:glycogen synthase
MKVLMTADAVGGVWTYAMELSAALAVHDVEIVLATMGPRPSATQRDQAAAIANVRLHCADYKLEWMADAWEDVCQAGEWLQALAAQESVDVVHLNGYAHAALSWRQPVVSVAHSCVCSWWHAVHRTPPPMQWDTYRQKVREGLAHADYIVAPTQAFLGEVQRLHGPSAPACVIHNARSPTLFAPKSRHERLPILFACGRLWDEAKGLRTLDAVARDLPWNAYVAGDATAPEGAQVKAQSVRCLGSLSTCELASWLQRAAIFMHPAKYEPFGLSILEAALAGCALVLADLPTLRELWQDAAEFVDPNDAPSVSRLLHSLIAQPARRRWLSEAAQARAQRYRPESMAAAYASLYRGLLTGKQQRERAVA